MILPVVVYWIAGVSWARAEVEAKLAAVERVIWEEEAVNGKAGCEHKDGVRSTSNQSRTENEQGRVESSRRRGRWVLLKW